MSLSNASTARYATPRFGGWRNVFATALALPTHNLTQLASDSGR